MTDGNTTEVVQRYLGELAGDGPADPIVRQLLDRAVLRLQRLCATLLHREYPRLTRSPLNLQTDELLSAVVERLLKALRQARPRNVREFFALAGQHMRWELNDLARRLDKQPAATALHEGDILTPASSDGGLSAMGRRMLETIDNLPEDEREAFDGYAMWTYHATPFVFAESGYEVHEIEPISHEGEKLRGLTVKFPVGNHSHSRNQRFYFGSNGLLKRHDYEVEVWANMPAVHFLSDYVDVGGLKFPSRRRVFVREPDGRPNLLVNLVNIDLADYTFF